LTGASQAADGFPSPLIKLDVSISNIQLSDWFHRSTHASNPHLPPSTRTGTLFVEQVKIYFISGHEFGGLPRFPFFLKTVQNGTLTANAESPQPKRV
jgi:hypothetical protein